MSLRAAARRVGDAIAVVGAVAAVVAVTASVVAPGVVAPVQAIDSTPSASPSPSPFLLGLEAWLDDPLPADAAPGSEVTIAATLWDPAGGQLASWGGAFIRILPAAGSGPASEVPATHDEPWHVTGTLPVPEGGLGVLEIGVQGSACDDSGCSRTEGLFTIAGAGPPEGAALPSIAIATIERPLAKPVAGEPATLSIVLDPKIDWESEAFERPPALVLRVRIPRGGVLDEVKASLADAASGRYEVSVTFDEAGSYALDVAVAPNASDADVFAGSVVAVEVLPGPEPSGEPAPGSGAPDGTAGGGPDPLLILGLGVVAALVIGVVTLGRRSSDGDRRTG